MMAAASASWGEVEQFCKNDGWTGIRKTKHVFYEKALDSGEVLQCKVSHARDKVPSPGRFKAVLAHELKVPKEEFWECLRTGEPVARPAAVEEVVVQHPAWVVIVLKRDLHLSDDEIDALSREDAEARVKSFWAGNPASGT